MIRHLSLSRLFSSIIDEIMTLRYSLLHTSCTVNLFLITFSLFFFLHLLRLPFKSRFFTAHFGLFKFLFGNISFTFPWWYTAVVTLIMWFVYFYWFSSRVRRFRSIIKTFRIAILKQLIGISYLWDLRIHKIISLCYCL